MKFNGKRLKDEREKLGMGQQTFAERIGVDKNSVCNWELGKFAPGIVNALKICKLTDVPMSDFFEEV